MKRLLILTLFFLLYFWQPSPALAWNGAGHMTTGAIAYKELQTQNPDVREKVIKILKANPKYETLWQPKLSEVAESQQNELLFMLAARWADDIRRDNRYNHPKWHYINLPYKPDTEPDSVTVSPPDSENILSAIALNLEILASNASDRDKSIALCWLFHLVGDIHQPLHTTTLYTKQFPHSDRGGTKFYIKVKPDLRTTISLHRFWDDALGSSKRYQTVRDRASRLRLIADFQRDNLPQLAETDFNHWAEVESFALAKEFAYLNGTLEGSTDEDNGAVLPSGYVTQAKLVAQKQAVIAGYRLADLLSDRFGSNAEN